MKIKVKKEDGSEYGIKYGKVSNFTFFLKDRKEDDRIKY